MEELEKFQTAKVTYTCSLKAIGNGAIR